MQRIDPSLQALPGYSDNKGNPKYLKLYFKPGDLSLAAMENVYKYQLPTSKFYKLALGYLPGHSRLGTWCEYYSYLGFIIKLLVEEDGFSK